MWEGDRLAAAQLLAWCAVFSLAFGQTQQCHQHCKVCHLFDYNLEWHCLECHPGYELWVDGCFAPCPSGQYRYGYECRDCPRNCIRCMGGHDHECLECASDFYFDFRSVCVRTCLDGLFSVGEDCVECNTYCKTCIAGATTSCTSCFTGYTLRILEPNTGSGECMQVCDQGFYRDAPSDRRCIECPQHCAACESPDHCTECVAGAGLHLGACYLVPQTAANEAIDFNTFLESGAGIQWNQSEAPNWDVLSGGRRLQQRSAERSCHGAGAQGCAQQEQTSAFSGKTKDHA